MVPVPPLEPVAVVVVAGLEEGVPVFEFKPGCRYAVVVDIQGLFPPDAEKYLTTIREKLGAFLGAPCIVIAAEHGTPQATFYELHTEP